MGFHGLQACVTTVENLEERHCWLSSTAVATWMAVQAVSAKAGLFYFLICLTSQRSERPSDLWHSRRSAEHIPMIRKEKPSTARTHGTACHTAGLHTSLSHIAAQSLLFRTTSPSILWALAMKKACPWGNMWLTMWQQNLDYCRGSKYYLKVGAAILISCNFIVKFRKCIHSVYGLKKNVVFVHSPGSVNMENTKWLRPQSHTTLFQPISNLWHSCSWTGREEEEREARWGETEGREIWLMLTCNPIVKERWLRNSQRRREKKTIKVTIR